MDTTAGVDDGAGGSEGGELAMRTTATAKAQESGGVAPMDTEDAATPPAPAAPPAAAADANPADRAGEEAAEGAAVVATAKVQPTEETEEKEEQEEHPPLTRAAIDKMKVSEMRAELELRGMDQGGLKATLAKRLKAIAAD
jgi:hypothetical protein